MWVSFQQGKLSGIIISVVLSQRVEIERHTVLVVMWLWSVFSYSFELSLGLAGEKLLFLKLPQHRECEAWQNNVFMNLGLG